MKVSVKRYNLLYIGIFIFLIDFASKLLTHLYLPVMKNNYLRFPYGGIGVFKNFFGVEFSLSHQINKGAAWGLLKDFQVPLVYFRIGLIVLLIIYALWFNKKPSWRIPLILIITGALGNVLDYFLYGHVIDMLHFILWGYDFPVFNVADSSICIGITWILIASFFEKSPPSKQK